MSGNAKRQLVAWVLIAVTIVAGLVGWLFFERDPAGLSPLLLPLLGLVAVNAGENVGKRATVRPELMPKP